MDEPRSLSASAPDTASSPAPPDAQQISSDPEPDADDWDVEPGSRKGGSGAAAPGMAEQQDQQDQQQQQQQEGQQEGQQRRQGGGAAADDDELDDLRRISEESRNLALSLSWEDADEELREFLASGDEEEYEEDEVGDGDDGPSSKDAGRRSTNADAGDRRVGDETGSVGRYVVWISLDVYA